MRRRLVTGALCAITLLGATLSTGACATTTLSPTPQPASRDVLLAREIASAHVADAYQAIERLRPEYLRRDRGATSLFLTDETGLTVYQDNVQLGDVRSLRDIPVEAIRSIRFLDAAAATIRWGMNHTGGVILVQTIGGEH